MRAHLVTLGILLYTYTYLMYVVLSYNDAFLLYVAVIGLGSYLFFDGYFASMSMSCATRSPVCRAGGSAGSSSVPEPSSRRCGSRGT